MGEIRTYIRDDCLQTAIEVKSVVAAHQSAVREKNHTKKIIAEKGAFANMRSRYLINKYTSVYIC